MSKPNNQRHTAPAKPADGQNLALEAQRTRRPAEVVHEDKQDREAPHAVQRADMPPRQSGRCISVAVHNSPRTVRRLQMSRRSTKVVRSAKSVA